MKYEVFVLLVFMFSFFFTLLNLTSQLFKWGMGTSALGRVANGLDCDIVQTPISQLNTIMIVLSRVGNCDGNGNKCPWYRG